MNGPKIRYEPGDVEISVMFVMFEPNAEVDVHYSIPVVQGDPFDEPSKAQRESIQQFYHMEPPDLTEELAHVLLSVRQFAKRSTELIVGGMIDKRDVISRITATFILNDADLINEAVRASDRQFYKMLEEIPVSRKAKAKLREELELLLGDLDYEALRPLRGVIQP